MALPMTRFTEPKAPPKPIDVADASTHELLAGVLEALAGVRAMLGRPQPSPVNPVDVSGLARDDTLARLETRLGELSEALGDIATRPSPAPQVVTAPIPEEVMVLLRQLAALRVPDKIELDKALLDAVREIKPAVAVQGGVGTMALQKVIEKMKDALTGENDGGPVSTQENRPDDLTPATGTRSTAGEDTMVAAPGAGLRLRVWLVQATTDTDSELFPRIVVKDTDGLEWFRGAAVSTSHPFPLAENVGLVLATNEDGAVHWTVHTTTEAV